MSNSQISYAVDETNVESQSPRFLDKLARNLVFRTLSGLDKGKLSLSEGGESFVFGNEHDDLKATISISDSRFYGAVAYGGSVGAAEAYMQGYWHCDDLTSAVRIFARNRDVLDGMETGMARLAAPMRKVLHRINRNTRNGSRKNIAAHYDLGNDFFKLWLDDTMMYSSAVFERDDMSLREASEAKLDRICRKLELGPDDHVLEIGTGWGGFALHAASRFGCRVTTTTISREQHEFAKQRIREAGLEDRVELLLEDYRDLDGRYDKLVSIEMIEAVGHEFMDTYFEKCAGLLEEDGMMLLQAITIADQRYAGALKSVDFIQKYIFPGGFLPSVTAIADSLTRSTNMRLFHLEDIGPHYAETLKHWRDAFTANLDRIWSIGYREEFLRMWYYYYCYCEGAFRERAIGTVQALLVKPDARRVPLVPAL
jgi:cyclopropane-fatty-acyl-phospholipid synthase